MRLIFQPVIPQCDHPEILAYIEPLVPVTTVAREDGTVEAVPDQDSGLTRIKRLHRQDLSRFGMVIRLTDIWRPVDIVPAFGEKCDKNWTSDTALDKARTFLINSFYSKDDYMSLTA